MAATGKRQANGKSGALTLKTLLYLLILGGVLIAALPTATLVAVGMLPTIVALIVDLTPGRYLCRCVAGLNVAGLATYVHKLWTGGNDMAAAIGIISDSFAWLTIYGAAGLGWLLFMGFPGAVAVFQTLNAKRRIYVLHDRQKALLEEWGDSIRSPAAMQRAAGRDDDGPGAAAARHMPAA